MKIKKKERVQGGAKTGLVLSGGGARGAYQVGVLKAIADLHPKHAPNPFSVISGTSAGALNAVALAASANNFRLGVKKVEKIWANLAVDSVVHAGAGHMLLNSARLVGSLFNSGMTANRPVGLLDNEPLRHLLSHVIQFRNIQRRIDAGLLDAVAVSATSYATGRSVTFYQGCAAIGRWHRSKRIGVPATLGVDHLLGSSAIPVVFPAQKIGRQYFGDGSLRQLSPLSPALKLGAERVLVIGVRGRSKTSLASRRDHVPSIAQTIGQIFSSAFVDSMENDLETLLRINSLATVLENEAPGYQGDLPQPIDALVVRPSVDFDEIALQHLADLPRSLRLAMRLIGAQRKSGGGGFASYLLFHANYCNELIACGYKDAMAMKDDIADFFGVGSPQV